MNANIPEEPKFIRNATSIQKWLAGIAVSMFIVVYVTGWGWVSDFFKPDFVVALRYLRVGIALFGIGLSSIVGYQQLTKMISWLIDSWEVYRNLLELKRNKDKDK